jgi:hypothetical protein
MKKRAGVNRRRASMLRSSVLFGDDFAYVRLFAAIALAQLDSNGFLLVGCRLESCWDRHLLNKKAAPKSGQFVTSSATRRGCYQPRVPKLNPMLGPPP